MSKIEKLCKKYTELTSEDIQILIDYEKTINTMSQLVRADIFIDCLTKDKNKAIVVAQSNFDKSLYCNSVIGEFANRKDEPAVLRALELDVYVKEFKGLSQEKFLVRQTVTPIKNGEKVIGALILEANSKNNEEDHDIQEIKKDEINIENNLSFKSESNDIIDYVAEGVVIFNSKNEVVYANQKAIEIYKKLGYINNILDMTFEDISFHKLGANLLKEKFIREDEIQIGKLSLNIKYIKTDKNQSQLTMIVKDITEKKQKDKELIVKSVAINEMNHRIKNNLQTIISLLNLQARRVEDKEVFMDCINRINSISIIHEIISNTNNQKVNLHLLCQNIINMYRHYNVKQEISFEVAGDHVYVDGEIASAVSMVVTEALQNISKHAFVNKNEGMVNITIEDNDLVSKVIISDNGVGFNSLEVEKNSLGISIMKGIVEEKIKSQLKINSTEKGTRLEFEILKGM